MIERNKSRDSEWECNETLTIQGLKEHVTAVGNTAGLPCCLSSSYYSLLSFFVLNYPLCIWFDCISLSSNLHVHKQISIIPPAPNGPMAVFQQAPPQSVMVNMGAISTPIVPAMVGPMSGTNEAQAAITVGPQVCAHK